MSDSTTISINPSSVVGPVPAMRGVYLGDSPHPFVEDDVARLKKEVGVTCIRFGMEPRQLTEEKEAVYHEKGFQYVQQILDWCQKYDIHCVLDQHNALGRAFGGDPRLWKEQYFQDRFVGLWEQIARRFKGHPAVCAYEFLNEPEPPNRDFEVWNKLYRRTLDAVRKIDPFQTVIVDSVGYARADTFHGLDLSGDPNTVYSFHNYAPGPYHCQKRQELKDQSTYYYPGFIPKQKPEKPQDFNQVHIATAEGKYWNRKQLIEEFSEALEYGERHQVPLFCGEFGCVSDVPPMTDMVYLMDEISIFQERGIGWTLYNTMYRTSEDYWKTHFDCGIYIYHVPEKKLFRFDRKIALMEFFCRTEGQVLKVLQPQDEWVGVYGVRRPDGSVAVLVSNKDRENSRDVTVNVSGMPGVWPVGVKRMSLSDNGFVLDSPKSLANGAVRLSLPPLTILQLTIEAPQAGGWRRQ